ncbi:hypothetical protein [Rhizobium leguminosarum]|jgi:hypothetical protein|uniref:hypothetical protein n=1 Tax=Rhizobium leguminosarum TaxID=384 RepID=UPI00036260A1|nr:hypothetical protein [Rhizobium leguminosarum]MBY2918335.1 hypothetical protein [Rhizobium leguminosarum]MBY2924924.1 hypothetical protein [Rhizobium leguminosarum]MBY2962756.1 hypothetical protein [Rhizobium leguminosarum]MBY2973822.1 hypothetical protein [Rhizobium leguminosarum]MBY2981222.1 hypothetical protein [Rhizobium leguminosarum]
MFSSTAASAWRGPQHRSKSAHVGEKVPEKQLHPPVPEASMRLAGSFQIDGSL